MPRETAGRLRVGEAATATPQDERLLRVGEVATMLGLSVRAVWRWSSSGALPAPLRIRRSVTRWRQSEILAWIAAGGELREADRA